MRLGDVGGYRNKILDQVGKIQADFLAGIDAVSDKAQVAKAALSGFGSEGTATAHLDTTHLSLQSAQKYLGSLRGPKANAEDADLEKALAQALADVEAAQAYVKTHPETDALKSARESQKMPPMPLGLMVWRDTAPNDCVVNLRLALAELINVEAENEKGLVLDEFDGLRSKIIADIDRVGAKIDQAVEQRNAEATEEGIKIFSTNIAHQSILTADAGAERSKLPSVLASITLSLGLAIGGLHFFGRKRA